MDLKKNYYQILNVPSNANSQQIKESFRLLAKKFHPDLSLKASGKAQYQQNAPSLQDWHDIFQAYRVLSDEKRRKEYDFQNIYQLGDHSEQSFDYVQFLLDRQQKKQYQLKLLIYYMFHDEEKTLSLYQNTIKDFSRYSWYLSKQDYMDYSFILSELFLKSLLKNKKKSMTSKQYTKQIPLGKLSFFGTQGLILIGQILVMESQWGYFHNYQEALIDLAQKYFQLDWQRLPQAQLEIWKYWSTLLGNNSVVKNNQAQEFFLYQ